MGRRAVVSVVVLALFAWPVAVTAESWSDGRDDVIDLRAEELTAFPRADITGAAIDYNASFARFALTVAGAVPVDAAVDDDWLGLTFGGFAIDEGSGTFEGPTTNVEFFWANGDNRAMGVVFGGPMPWNTPACVATPALEGGTYRLIFPAECLGLDGPSVRAYALMAWDIDYRAGESAERIEPEYLDFAPIQGGITITRAQPRPGERIAAPSRIETAVAISQHGFPNSAAVVYLARADLFADAVAGGTLIEGPTLLVPSCGELPADVYEEIQRLDPPRVVALGGEAAVCDAILEQAVAYPPGEEPEPEPTPTPTPTEDPLPIPIPIPTPTPTPTEEPPPPPPPTREADRLAGEDRFDTAVAISQERYADTGAEVARVYLAGGTAFADAVSGGALVDGPILLVPACDAIPDSVRDEVERLDPADVIALGGQAAVCEATLSALAAGRPTGRYEGGDRYATSARIAQAVREQRGGNRVYIANGLSLADAVAAGSLPGPVLLVPPCGAAPDPTRAFIGPNVAEVWTLGGTGAVCEEVRIDAAAARSG